MSDDLRIEKSGELLTAAIRRRYASRAEQGILTHGLWVLSKLSADKTLSAKEMFEAVSASDEAWRRGRQGVPPDDKSTWGDMKRLLLGSAAVVATKNPKVGVIGAYKEAGQEVMETTFFQNLFGEPPHVYARRVDYALVKRSENLPLVAEHFADTCLSDSRCAEAAARYAPELTASLPQFGAKPAEVVRNNPDVLESVIPASEIEFDDASGHVIISRSKLKKSLTDDFAELTKAVRASTEGLHAELDAIQKAQQSVAAWVETQKSAEKKRLEAQKKAEERVALIREAEPLINVAEAGLGAIVALMGLADPRAAKQIQQVGAAVTGVARAGIELMQGVVNLSKGFEAAVAVGTAAATFNFIGAAAGVISLFVGSAAPSPEEMILEEIDSLRTEMRRYQSQVLGRLDQIDRKLESIYIDVMGQFDQVDIQVGMVSDKANRALDVLADQSERLNRIEQGLVDYFQADDRADLLQTIDQALGRGAVSTNPVMTLTEFQEFQGVFYNWATERSSGPLESPRPNRGTGNEVLYDVLDLSRGRLHSNLHLIAAAVRHRQWPDFAQLGKHDSIANPESWAVAADAYAQLESEWPDHAWHVSDAAPTLRRAQVAKPGRDLIAMFQRIETKLGDDGISALERACEEVRITGQGLAEKVEEEATTRDDERTRLAESRGAASLPMWRTPRLDAFEYTPHISTPFDLPLPDKLAIPAILRAAAFVAAPETVLALQAGNATDIKILRIPTPKPTYKYMGSVEVVLTLRGTPVIRWDLRLDRLRPSQAGDQDIPASEVFSPVNWSRAWLPLLQSGEAKRLDLTGGAVTEKILDQVHEWQRARSLDELFPPLGEAILSRSSRIADQTASYGGARRLLESLITLAMPDDREGNDLLRAFLDGQPAPRGGVAVPDLSSLAAIVSQGTTLPHPPRHDGERPLHDFIAKMIDDAVGNLKEYLLQHRQAVMDDLLPPTHNMLETSLLRLELAESIVAAQGRMDGSDEETPAPPSEEFYVVRKGDSLSSIAKKLNVKGGWKRLYEDNRAAIGPKPDELAIGIRLHVPR
ncbi:LysM peptidoglycan-binding domain-containing protein [Agromyces sp. ZXT2-6]|uniref:LysM peptidoglycan-binding domain-containing protein n=1 Tax=Agromyces sp. ZXT2-6 TaxID=3461153 RepID=UPI004054D035